MMQVSAEKVKFTEPAQWERLVLESNWQGGQRLLYEKNGDRAISTNQKIVKRAGKRKIRTELQSRKNELFAE